MRATIGELRAFLRESLRIEDIHREPTDAEVEATEAFLGLPEPTVADLSRLVAVYQPGALLRRRRDMNVRVGSHVAPPGGPEIASRLDAILVRAARNADHPFVIHVDFETLHPFTDGNGRGGRALWAWQMLRFSYRPGLALGFLHCWYYQSLECSRLVPPRATGEPS